jgi:hypothetical protein
VKYIPAEIVAVFVAIDGVLKAASNVLPSFYWLMFVVLLGLTALYTWRFTAVKGLPPAYVQIVISTVAFAVWVFALGGPFRFLEWYNPVYGSALLMVYTLVPPLVIGK